ncbi:protein RD3-like [Brachyhypopomus gauderio]|uniref:protein RD3-like n=1 Tax=Brachyhypopomus gauderio TaxID=698409 RepID=UPI0040438616
MGSQYHSLTPHLPPARPAVPFLAWLKWPHVEGEQGAGSLAPGGPAQELMQELLWQKEQMERQVLEKELQGCFSQGTVGRGRPGSFSPVPASERRQLERLCACIPASHTVCVLSRFREILAHSDVLPWEVACVFKQVLNDFLRRQEKAGHRRPSPPYPTGLLPVSSSPAPPSPDLQEGSRGEIPTVSSYVDRHVRCACPYTVQRDCLPCCMSYSTTL